MATANPGPLVRKAVEFLETLERLFGRAKQPDFSQDEWGELAALVAADDYERVAANKNSRRWQEDIAVRGQWAATVDFRSEIRRAREVGNLVYVDFVEEVTADGRTNAVNTLGVFEFNEAGKLRKLLTYQQVAPQPAG